MIQEATSNCLRYNYLDSLFNGCLSDKRSVFSDNVLGIFLANIFCGLFVEVIRGLVMQKSLQCRGCSSFLRVVVFNNLGFRPYVGPRGCSCLRQGVLLDYSLIIFQMSRLVRRLLCVLDLFR